MEGSEEGRRDREEGGGGRGQKERRKGGGRSRKVEGGMERQKGGGCPNALRTLSGPNWPSLTALAITVLNVENRKSF